MYPCTFSCTKCLFCGVGNSRVLDCHFRWRPLYCQTGSHSRPNSPEPAIGSRWAEVHHWDTYFSRSDKQSISEACAILLYTCHTTNASVHTVLHYSFTRFPTMRSQVIHFCASLFVGDRISSWKATEMATVLAVLRLAMRTLAVQFYEACKWLCLPSRGFCLKSFELLKTFASRPSWPCPATGSR